MSRGALIEWLRRDPRATPAAEAGPVPMIEVAGRLLPARISRHARARRLTLRLAPDGSAVRITLPQWCGASEAVAFARARSGWLAQQLAKVPPAADPVQDGYLTFCGMRLEIDWHPDAPRMPQREGQRLRVGGPRETLSRRLQRWLEAEAVRLFAADAEAYCARGGIAPAEVRLTRALRRWGSCSSERVLRLNWRLVQAPDWVRRSVVAHEIAHLVHFDHSPAFHALLATLYEDDVERANAWLRTHGRTLYAAFG